MESRTLRRIVGIFLGLALGMITIVAVYGVRETRPRQFVESDGWRQTEYRYFNLIPYEAQEEVPGLNPTKDFFAEASKAGMRLPPGVNVNMKKELLWRTFRERETEYTLRATLTLDPTKTLAGLSKQLTRTNASPMGPGTQRVEGLCPDGKSQFTVRVEKALRGPGYDYIVELHGPPAPPEAATAVLPAPKR